MEFNFSSFGALVDSFKSPDRETSVQLRNTSLRIQRRGAGSSARYYLRFSSFGRVNYYTLEKSDLLRMAEALVAFAETDTQKGRETPRPEKSTQENAQ